MLFDQLEAARVGVMAKAVENKAAADKYGKRNIAYEAGQHIIAPANSSATVGVANATMQRSPLMEEAYRRYLADWKAKVNDTITIYSATGSISQYGSWGIREYAGQPVGETPKRRAVLTRSASVDLRPSVSDVWGMVVAATIFLAPLSDPLVPRHAC